MKKILLIEDNNDIRENTAEILELAGYNISTAENGKVGVKMAVEQQFDLIICDIMMPELDGYGVLHILNQNPKTSAIPFVFLTAKSEKTDFRKGMGMGADDYLTKPFDETDLLDTVMLRLKKAESMRVEDKPQSKESIQTFLGNAERTLALEDLVNERNTRTFKRKDTIFREGEYPHALHYIKNGKVKLSRSSDYGKEFITQLCGPGEFLGYLALLENTPFSEEATAMEDSEIALIPIEDFRKLIYSNREVSNNFIKILSRNVLENEERLLKLAYGNVRERVATVIRNLYEKYGDETSGQINLAISRDELAGYAGIATESLIRTISDFKSEGILSDDGKPLVISDLKKLVRISNGGI